MTELSLSSDKEKLIIKTRNNNWSDVYIEKNSKRVKLGSQSLDTILYSFIISFIELSDRTFFEYLDYKLFTVVNLMDSHSVIAGRYHENNIELYHLDTNGNVQYLLSLSEPQRIKFIKETCSIISKCGEK